MGKMKISHLWLSFVVAIFITMLLLFFAAVALITSLSQGYQPPPGPHKPQIPFMPLFVISLIISTLVTLIIGKVIFRPLIRLNQATEKVARGDFSVELDSKSNIYEISDTFARFNAMVRELGSIETLRKDFIATVSHEFKSPLASIEGYATMLQSPDLTEAERLEYTRIIIESSRQLSGLTGSILLLSKLENLQALPATESFRLDEQLRQAVLLLESQWEKKKQTLNIDLPSVQYTGCRELLLHVWLNLIGNAIKFTPDEGIITISLSASSAAPTPLSSSDPCVTVVVKDNGIGMSDQVRARIFDKFYQGDNSHFTEGNGLGLALTARILSLSKGTIAVESQLDAGSTFTVKLPGSSMQ